MSIKKCKCNGAPLNPGTSGCIEQITTWDYAVRVDHQDASGNVNSIPFGTDINEAFVLAKLNNNDKSVRWTIFPKLWSIEDVRADPLTETIDNIDFVERQGTRTFVGFHIGKFAAPQIADAWNSASCRDNAVFGLTSGGQIEGLNPDVAVGDLEPIPMEDDTLIATYMKPTKAPTKQKVQVNFAIKETVDDGCLDFIASDDITYSTINWYSDQPVEVIAKATAGFVTTTTTLSVDFSEMLGSVDKNKVVGILSPDFSPDDGSTPDTIFNKTTSLNVALISVVELPNGTYLLTFAAQALTNVMVIDISVDGFFLSEPLEVIL